MRVISLSCAVLYGQIQASADQDHRLIPSKRTTGAHDVWSAMAASSRCLRSCTRVVAAAPQLPGDRFHVQHREVPQATVGSQLWVPKTVSPYLTWAYWWLRSASRSRRRTRLPSPTRGYIRGIRQEYRRLSGQDHFAASALPDSGPVLVEITDRVHPPMRVPDPTLRLAGIHQVQVVIIFPQWSRPPGFHVCSMFARMSRYHA